MTASTAAVAGVAMGAGSGGSAEATSVPQPSSAERAFGVLQKVSPDSAISELPPGFGEALTDKGLDPAAMRTIVTADGSKVFVTPGDELTCIAATTQISAAIVGACGPTSKAVVSGLFATLRPSPAEVEARHLAPGTVEIVGLVPDGTAAVTLDPPTGDAATVPVKNNVITAVLDNRPSQIKFRDAAGAQQTLDTGDDR